MSNGIPITPFKEDKTDKEFLFLKRFLADIRGYDDLREPIDAAFCLEELYSSDKYNFDSFIEYYDYEDCEVEQDLDDEYEIEEEEKSRVAGPPP